MGGRARSRGSGGRVPVSTHAIVVGRFRTVLACGSRSLTYDQAIDWVAIWLAAAQRIYSGSPMRLIHGAGGKRHLGCHPTGADFIAADRAFRLGWEVVAYPARWVELGKSAGPIRNQQMIDTGPNLVLAFLEAGKPCRGTRDTIERAEDARIPTVIVVCRSLTEPDRELDPAGVYQ